MESVHGIIEQKYQLMFHIIDNKLLPNDRMYFKIAAFLHNQFGKVLKSDAHLSEEIERRMKYQLPKNFIRGFISTFTKQFRTWRK